MTTSARIVQKIEGRASLTGAIQDTECRKKRVAAYARVSTDSDEQLSSYEAQVDFYTRHIKSHSEWDFVSVYTDEGISGTNTKKREGFNRMVADAMAGKIDLILTKSISRFARNTVDTLTAIRQLKAKGVEVYFEKENIYTLDAKGEVMITIMSSLAQEESRSISENVTWGKRRSMEEGKVGLPYKNFLGYEKGEDGLPKIVENEAKTVRTIYQLFLEGQTVRMIADYLTRQGVPTPMGKTNWSVSTIMSILQNEKYKGDALLQKTYTIDFLNKKTKKNQGEVPQYYIENSHPAIIAPETFDLVQKEIERRRSNRCKLHRNSPFTAKIVCSECGGYYGRKTWHSGTKYQKFIWRCNCKYDNTAPCTTPNLSEEEIKATFLLAFNRVLCRKEEHITSLEKLLHALSDARPLEIQLEQAKATHAGLLDSLRRYMEENTRQIQDQEEYNRRFDEMDNECKKAEEQISGLQKAIMEQAGQKEQVRRSLEILRGHSNALSEFDERLWDIMVEAVKVFPDKTLAFRFRDGTEIPAKMPTDGQHG